MRQFTLYFVGETAEDAFDRWPFDSQESAESYLDDQYDDSLKIFCATVTASLDDLEKCS